METQSQVTIGDENTIPNLQAAGQALLNGGTITSSSIAPVNNPLTIVDPIPDNTPSLVGTTQGAADYLKTLDSNLTAAEAKSDETQQTILSTMNKLLGKSGDTATANETSGVNAAAKRIRDLNAQIQATNRESQAIPLKVQEDNRNTGATDRGIAPQEAGRLRMNALKALSLAQEGDLAIADYASAKDKADEIIRVKYEPLENNLKMLQQQYEFNKDSLDRIDKKRSEALNIALNKEAADLADKKANDKAIQDIKIVLAQNGASKEVLALASKATTIDEILQVGKGFISDPLERKIKEAQLREINTRIASNLNPNGVIMTPEQKKATTYTVQGTDTGGLFQIANNIGVDFATLKALNPQLGANFEIKKGQKINLPLTTSPNEAKVQALNSILGSTNFTKENKQSLINAIANGQDPLTVVKNRARDLMGTEGVKTFSIENSRDAMIELDSVLQAYYAGGGDTGIFKGNFEKIKNKLGKVDDPERVVLAAKVATSLQKYRNAISGTAYSEQEGLDIAAIFPGITKGQILNNAVVQARLETMNSDIDIAYSNVLGDSYFMLKQASAPQFQNPETGEIRTFMDMTQSEIEEAINSGFKRVN